MSSFWWMKDGRMIDAAITHVPFKCPNCGVPHDFSTFDYEEAHGTVGRRYYYVCPDCKIHYTNWGPDYDYRGKHKINKRCNEPLGAHEEDRRRLNRMMAEHARRWD